jgi:hypothetical protein
VASDDGRAPVPGDAVNRADRRAMESHRRKLQIPAVGGAFVEIPRSGWPTEIEPPIGMTRLFKNARLLVFFCDRPGGLQLMMVQRIDGRDGLTWDELYETKNVLGFADFEAVEIYPRVDMLVNVANMRHLWLLPNGRTMPFGLDKLRRSAGLG